MSILHVKSNAVADFTGTVTVFNSQGSTATANATDLVRPADWNSGHNFVVTIAGDTAGQSTASGTNMVYGGTNGVSLSLSTGAGVATLWAGVDLGRKLDPFGPGVEIILGQIGQNTLHAIPVDVFRPVVINLQQHFVHFTGATNSTGSYSISQDVAFTRT